MNRRTLLTMLALAPLAAHAQNAAQPELPKEKLTIVTHDGVRHDFSVEMALTQQQQETGLMFRPTVAPDGGMLFDWGRPIDSTMWMRNTIAPLDMVFINADGTVHRVEADTVPQSLSIIDSKGPVRATLELAAGTAKRLGIRPGDKVEAKIFGNVAS